MTEIGTSTKLGISHPCPAQAVLVLHSSGFDVSALYGGFGLWGVVIGYASRNILEDLFAGLLIVYRRWFTVGDYVVVGGVGGCVGINRSITRKLKSG